MFLFGLIFYLILHVEHEADLKQRSAEVQQRHVETQELLKEYKNRQDEINAIAHAKIGTDEFRELMYRLNQRDAQ